MPRAPRIDVPGLIYHVFSRGNHRSPLFHNDEDRRSFLRLLSQTRDEFPFRLHTYSLMTNHYHLLLQTLDQSLSMTMQYFKSLYAGWFNRKYQQVGHLFQGRFHSIPVQEDAYFTSVAAYIDLNAVRAGLVGRPEDYPWGSYGRTVQGEADPLADPTFLLEYFGRNVAQRRSVYQEFVNEKMGKAELIPERQLYRMRFWGDPKRIFRQVALSRQTS